MGVLVTVVKFLLHVFSIATCRTPSLNTGITFVVCVLMTSKFGKFCPERGSCVHAHILRKEASVEKF